TAARKNAKENRVMRYLEIYSFPGTTRIPCTTRTANECIHGRSASLVVSPEGAVFIRYRLHPGHRRPPARRPALPGRHALANQSAGVICGKDRPAPTWRGPVPPCPWRRRRLAVA